MLNIENAEKIFKGPEGDIRSVDSVSLSVAHGELVVVQGASGSGKTTLLLMAGGLLKPTEGKVSIGGQELYGLSSKKRSCFRAEKIGFVFQQFHLIPYFNVRENILSPAGVSRQSESGTRAEELICRFQLEHRCKHVPSQLSTGERQRTALARALINRPQIILADEPTGNLDKQNAVIVLDHLREFAAEGGAVLLVSHDNRTAEYADRTLIMEKGLINAS